MPPTGVNNITAAKINQGKCPEGSYLLIGSLPQYAYKFSPLILSGSKYSVESGEIHLHNSSE